MKREIRTVVYDEELKIEAYRFEGLIQSFPNHFHEYYVIGFIESGERALSCKNKEYTIRKGNTVLFNPGDNHACIQSDGGVLDYRGFHISKSVMENLAEEITGSRELPVFSENVIFDEEVTCHLCPLHELIMRGSSSFGKEEGFLFLLSLLIRRYGQAPEECVMEWCDEVERACSFMEAHFAEHICLEQICRYVGLSKSTLLRSFTRQKGITPYRYLENVRIGEAKKLLEQGVMPVEAAMRTGFSDQSHFSNYFNRYIGVAPGVYREIFAGRKSGYAGEESAAGRKSGRAGEESVVGRKSGYAREEKVHEK